MKETVFADCMIKLTSCCIEHGLPPLVDFRRDPLVVIKKNAGVNTVIAVWSKTESLGEGDLGVAPNELQRSLFPIQLVCMLIICFFFPFVFVIY